MHPSHVEVVQHSAVKLGSLDRILNPTVSSVCLVPFSALSLGIVPEVITGVGIGVVPIAVTVTVIVEVKATVTSVSLKTADISQ